MLEELIAGNRRWAERMEAEDPGFFARLARGQQPRVFWIGCSDSRVPATQIVDLPPGEIFVHRNVANVVADGDLNCLAALQFSVEVLKVEHVVVCGHYGCGGVQAALEGPPGGFVGEWIRHVVAVRDAHPALLEAEQGDARAARLCEVNALAQAAHVAATPVVRDAWTRGQPLAVHAWIYGIGDGRIRDLGYRARGAGEAQSALGDALGKLSGA